MNVSVPGIKGLMSKLGFYLQLDASHQKLLLILIEREVLMSNIFFFLNSYLIIQSFWVLWSRVKSTSSQFPWYYCSWYTTDILEWEVCILRHLCDYSNFWHKLNLMKQIKVHCFLVSKVLPQLRWEFITSDSLSDDLTTSLLFCVLASDVINELKASCRTTARDGERYCTSGSVFIF